MRGRPRRRAARTTSLDRQPDDSRGEHLGWVPDQTGGYRAQMAVLVKPNGLIGTGYMAPIRPFRRLIVYPTMMREIERDWRARAGDPTPAHA